MGAEGDAAWVRDCIRKNMSLEDGSSAKVGDLFLKFAHRPVEPAIQ